MKLTINNYAFCVLYLFTKISIYQVTESYHKAFRWFLYRKFPMIFEELYTLAQPYNEWSYKVWYFEFNDPKNTPVYVYSYWWVMHKIVAFEVSKIYKRL